MAKRSKRPDRMSVQTGQQFLHQQYRRLHRQRHHINNDAARILVPALPEVYTARFCIAFGRRLNYRIAHMSTLTQAQAVAGTREFEVEQSLLTIPDDLRYRACASTNSTHKKQFGQFLTPPHVADLMAGMFRCRACTIRLLDAGAGMGMLSAAFVQRQLMRPTPPSRIEVFAYELDKEFVAGIEKTFAACRAACEARGIEFSAIVRNTDFIEEGTEMLRDDFFSTRPQTFDAAIVNPPYGKLSTASKAYRRLRSVNAATTNLYTAFLNLIIGLLKPGGELVAITPRSFCNGPYFKPFRMNLLQQMAIRGIHVFDSRSTAFKYDKVLQENIILHAVKNAKATRNIRVSHSSGADGDTVRARIIPANEVASPDDPEAFIHIPTSERHLAARDQICRLKATLATLGLTVSTGRVVAFRAREHLRPEPDKSTAPLIYPCHFQGLFIKWPKTPAKKPNAIENNSHTANLFVPAGVYVLTKRFTSKEERKRVVACIYSPDRVMPGPVGFENHVNYIHANRQGLDMIIAKGLWAFLNSSALDLYFRQFNGHTQVNATDLRNIRFPTAAQLDRMGNRIGDEILCQEQIDQIVAEELKA
ncbi:MAG: Eco57I restriction-modification methylase domain-containing protein [Kiritimatiellia bacterium]|jgi:adenine-specific DNA-methyltransferase